MSAVEKLELSPGLNSLATQVSDIALETKTCEVEEMEMEPTEDLVQTSSSAEPPKETAVIEIGDETDSADEIDNREILFLGKFPTFRGFTDDDEAALFPKIDSDSAKLFAIKKLLDSKQRKAVIAALDSKGGEIILNQENPKVVLRHLKQHRPPPLLELAPMASSRYHAFLAWPENGVKLSDEQLAKCRMVFESGWKRETVLLSEGMREQKPQDAVVRYYSPTKEMLKSLEEVELYLAKEGSQLKIENFSFERVRISEDSDEEIVREMLPPKPPTPTGNSPPELDSSMFERKDTEEDLEED